MNLDLMQLPSLAQTLTRLGISTVGWQPATAQLQPQATAFDAGSWHVEIVAAPTPWPGPELAAYALGKAFLATDLMQAVVVCGAPSGVHPPRGQLMELRHRQEGHLPEKVLYCVWFGT